MIANTRRGAGELVVVTLVCGMLSAALTYPLVFRRVARDDADALFSIWNVAWVAHALSTDPAHVFDANIFYPHRGTLAYSENNLGAGAIAAPIYALTHDPYESHNVTIAIALMLSAMGGYYLVRRLSGDRRAAAVSGVCFAFCPYMYSHLAHIQLLMAAGIPLSMLAFHRLVDKPSPVRGAVLGLALGAQAVSCGYYAVFAMLIIGYAVVVTVAMRRLWLDRAFWLAIAIGAVVSIAIVLPVFLPYLDLQRAGFTRGLEESWSYSPNLKSYLASPARAHAWMLAYIPGWRSEVLFPGFIATIFGLVGLATGVRSPRREIATLYGGLLVMAFWASFGPQAGLYSVLYRVIPGFTLLRAPGRIGLIVIFALAVLAGLALSDLLTRLKHGTAIGLLILLAAVGEHIVGLDLPDAPKTAPVYRTLALMPRGPVIEMPFYYPAVGLFQHTKYMVASTAHWMPLVNGYSDYIPPDFYEHVMPLAAFPNREAFKILEAGGVRYAVFHWYGYNDENRHDVRARLAEFASSMRPLFQDEQSSLYEIVGYPAR